MAGVEGGRKGEGKGGGKGEGGKEGGGETRGFHAEPGSVLPRACRAGVAHATQVRLRDLKGHTQKTRFFAFGTAGF